MLRTPWQRDAAPGPRSPPQHRNINNTWPVNPLHFHPWSKFHITQHRWRQECRMQNLIYDLRWQKPSCRPVLLYKNVAGREQCPRSAVSGGAVMTSRDNWQIVTQQQHSNHFLHPPTPATTPATTAATTVLLSFSDISTLNCGLVARRHRGSYPGAGHPCCPYTGPGMLHDHNNTIHTWAVIIQYITHSTLQECDW